VNKISVIIPFYNDFKVVDHTLKSIFAQTFSDLEVILVDDGSNPPFESKKKSATHENITVIRTKNQGAPAARNVGLDRSSGDFVIFWDADIVAEQGMLEKMQQKLKQNTQASYCYCNYYFGNKKMAAQKFNCGLLEQRNYIHSTSLIRRKDCLRWDEDLDRFQDWDLWLRMYQQNKIGVWLDEYLFTIQQKDNSKSEWLPRFAYYPPFKWLPGFRRKVKDYEQAREKIQAKHNL
jgi:glycosyltransferase involved in cell wall biosynthesis